MKRFHLTIATAVLAAVATLALSPTATQAQELTKVETKCQATIVKSVGKLVSTIAKTTGGCLKDSPAASCPSTKDVGKVDKAKAKTLKLVTKKCASKCSVDDFSCMGELFCPPNGTAPQKCSGGKAEKAFDVLNLGYPGTLCGSIQSASDLVDCLNGHGQNIGDAFITNLHGSIDGDSGLLKEPAKCLSSLSKAATKAAAKITKAVGKCRGNVFLDPEPDISADSCPIDDEKTAADIAKNLSKLEATADKCSDGDIMALDLCGAGVGTTATVAEAKICLNDLVEEAAYSLIAPLERTYIATGILNAAYPDTASGRCGDNSANQLPNQFLLTGEECDGTDDLACPGQCLPPGDIFECTCATTKRVRKFADGSGSDLESGWTGNSHNAAAVNGAGFVSRVSGCDCAAFDPSNPMNCIDGGASDVICDTFGETQPRCDWDLFSGESCDDKEFIGTGSSDGTSTDLDCSICDDNSLNPGDYCSTEADCDAQCFDIATQTATATACSAQGDCAAGEICLGRCDKSKECVPVFNGAPLPLSAAGTSVCVVNEFVTAATGTGNIVTGEGEVTYRMLAHTHLADKLARPCPVCGGYCADDAPQPGEVCEGSCSDTKTCRGGSNTDGACTTDGDCPDGGQCWGLGCRFDDDCPGIETCTNPSFECFGSDCVLDLLCAGGDRHGLPCRIESYTEFGTTSADCSIAIGKRLGSLALLFGPQTTETVSLPDLGPCSAGGFELYDCNCSDTDPSPNYLSQPNGCQAACDTGAELGDGCAVGNTNGVFTACDGGDQDGRGCDEDSDCTGGGSCSNNPSHCVGDPAFRFDLCVNNGDCGGTSVCQDACPSGRCVPLCMASGVCDGGAEVGRDCAVDFDCPGSFCDKAPGIGDPEEGFCASGSVNRCDGTGGVLQDQSWRVCNPPDLGTGASCGDDFPLAGICRLKKRSCFLNEGIAEGGDTLNGLGDPTNFYSVVAYCIPYLTTGANVNIVAGLAGPGRLRQPGTAVPNFTSLP